MILEYLSGTQHPLYRDALSLYEMAFPPVERRSSERMLPEQAAFRGGVLTQDGALQGILFYWETAEFLFLEHFAMVAELRGRGLGAEALELLKNMKKPVILEIEPPVDELTSRRRGFYLRNGLRENSWQHFQAKYRQSDEPLELKLLSFPQPLTEEAWQGFEAWLAKTLAPEKR